MVCNFKAVVVAVVVVVVASSSIFSAAVAAASPLGCRCKLWLALFVGRGIGNV